MRSPHVYTRRKKPPSSGRGCSSSCAITSCAVIRDSMNTRQYYNRLSPVYDWIAGKAEGPLREAALERFFPRETESVLEIGCGTGTCLSTMAEAVGCRGKVV